MDGFALASFQVIGVTKICYDHIYNEHIFNVPKETCLFIAKCQHC